MAGVRICAISPRESKRPRKTVRQVERRVKATTDELAAFRSKRVASGQDKSRRAKKALTEANLRLVVSLAKRYSNRGAGLFSI